MRETKNVGGFIAVLALVAIFAIAMNSNGGNALPDPIINASHAGPVSGLNYSDLLESTIDAWYFNGNVTRNIGGKLSVPWFNGDNVCGVTNLQNGSNCNIGAGQVSFSQYCMVTDEFSQVGIILAGAQNQTAFDQWVNTTKAINSSSGQIPGWRVLVNETAGTFEACRTNVNSNCDTASDATHRIIIALYTGSNNTFFTDTAAKSNYRELANNLSRDSATYELVQSCRNSTLGTGQICWWLKAGKQATITGTDGAYTGYYPDAAIAFMMACRQTGNNTYCAIAGNMTANYLELSKFNGISFSVTPGRSYKIENFSGVTSAPYANCTNTCGGGTTTDGDELWETADAPRAFFLGTADYYQKYVINQTILPNVTTYMNIWVADKMTTSLTSVVYQYYPNGTNAASTQSGYKAQGWQAAGLISQNNVTQFNTTIRSALAHYSHTLKTWDSAACAGVYGQAFSMRMLMTGMGRDFGAFSTPASDPSLPSVSGGVNISINSPGNSTTITQNSVLFNVTAWNVNSTGSVNTTNGTLPQQLYASDFTATPVNDGWTLNSWTHDATGGVINNTADSGNAAWTQILNFSTYTNGYMISLNMSMTNFTNAKIFFGTNSGTQDGDRILLERNGAGGTLVNIKHDGGAFSSFTVAANTYVVLNISVNLTSGNVTVSSGASSWTNVLANNHLTVNGSYVAFVPGQNMSAYGGWNISSINVTNTGTPYNITTSSGSSNSTLNVTISYLNGTIIKQTNGSGNGSSVSINVTGIADGTYFWRVVANANDGSGQTNSINNMTFTINTSVADTTKPSFSNIQNSSINQTSVKINWSTSEAANGSVSYGTTTSLGSTSVNTTSATSLTVFLSGLTAGTQYYYNITACDSSGNCNTTGPNTFNTTNTPPNVTVTNISTVLYATANALFNATVGDADAGHTLNVTMRFYVAGVNVYNQTNTSIASGTTIQYSISETNFTYNQVVSANITVTDGRNTNSTITPNVTVALLPATISSFGITPASPTVGASVTFTLNCTPSEGTITTTAAQLNKPDASHQNVTLTLSSGTLYTGTYVVLDEGIHTAIGICVDQAGNRVDSSSDSFTGTAALSGGGGGGGGSPSTTKKTVSLVIFPALVDESIVEDSGAESRFKITNSGSSYTTVTVSVSQTLTSAPLFNYLSIVGSQNATKTLYLAPNTSLATNEAFVEYKIAEDNNLEPGNYTAVFNIESGGKVYQHKMILEITKPLAASAGEKIASFWEEKGIWVAGGLFIVSVLFAVFALRSAGKRR